MASPWVGIRCDASPSTGVGHVTRCVAVAEELQERGFQVSFIGRYNEVPWVQALLHPFRVEDPDTAVWPSYAAVVVDTYDDVTPLMDELRRMGRPVALVVDDATPPMRADIYIIPGVIFSWRPPQGHENAIAVAGPTGVLLRHGVLATHMAKATHAGSGGGRPYVALSLGGSGSSPFLSQTLELLCRANLGVDIHVIGGPLPGPDRPEATWHANGARVQPMIDRATALVCAAGVTSWEALHRGTAVGLVATAANQESNYRYMVDVGAAVPLGRLHRGEQIDTDALRRLVQDEGELKRLRLLGPTLVDGLGASRAAEAVLQLVAKVQQKSLSNGARE